MIYALFASLAAGAIACAILASLWKGAQAALAEEKAAHAKTQNDLMAVTKGLELSEASRGDEKARAEAMVVKLKQEITSLENDLVACGDPDLVRERLRQLLSA